MIVMLIAFALWIVKKKHFPSRAYYKKVSLDDSDSGLSAGYPSTCIYSQIVSRTIVIGFRGIRADVVYSLTHLQIALRTEGNMLDMN